MKVTMIIGEPAAGKSHIIRRLLNLYGEVEFVPIPWVPHHRLPDGTRILGDYRDPAQQYPGTDRLSMAVQPHAVGLFINWRNARVPSVLFEGDRLGNGKFLKTLHYICDDLEVLHLFAHDSVMNARHAGRTQTDTFRKSRRTKVANLIKYAGKRGIPVRSMCNETPDDAERIVLYLLGRM